MLRLIAGALLVLVVLSGGLTDPLPTSGSEQAHSPDALLPSQAPSYPVSMIPAATSPTLFSFRDDFNYASIDDMMSAGWAKCGGPGTPQSYYSVSGGVLTLLNDGTNGAAACWNGVPRGVADWAFNAKAQGSRIGMVAFAGGHTYWVDADASTGTIHLHIDSNLVLDTGHFAWDYQWHDLGVQVKQGMVSLFFEDLVIGRYAEPDQNTTLTGIDLPAAWDTPESFDYITISQVDPTAPDYTFDALPASQTISYGQNTTFEITLTSQNNFAGSVNLTAMVSQAPGQLPYPSVPLLALSLALVPLAPNGQNFSILTVSTLNMVNTGSFSIRLNATSGQVYHSIALALTVNPPLTGQDFTLVLPNTYVAIRQRGDDGTWPVESLVLTLTSVGGFTGTIVLDTTLSGLAPTILLSPQRLFLSPNGTALATLTIARGCSCDVGQGTLTIQAYTGGTYHLIELGIEFITSYFTMTASPGFTLATPRALGRITVTVQSHNGFNGTVNLSLGLIPNFVEGPAVSLSPLSVRPPANGTVTATVTITMTPYTVASDYTVTVDGDAGWTNSSATAKVSTQYADYLPGVTPGAVATYTVVIAGPINATSTLVATVTSISEANVTYDLEFFEGQAYNSTQAWINVETGDFSPSLPPLFLIAANLAPREALYAEGIFRQVPLQSRETATLAGVRRTVNVLRTPPGSSITLSVIWDAQTGILGSFDETFPYNGTLVTLRLGLTETSAWTGLSGALEVSTTSGVAPLRVQFISLVEGGQPPYSYSWNFGDGMTAATPAASHWYTNSGNYTVTLNVTDSAGNFLTSHILIRTRGISPAGSSSIIQTLLSLLSRHSGTVMAGLLAYLGIAVAVSMVATVEEGRRTRAIPEEATRSILSRNV